MGLCRLSLAKTQNDIVRQLTLARKASCEIGLAIKTSHFNDESSQSKEWNRNAARGAKGVADFFFDTLLPQLDKSQSLKTAAGFSAEFFPLRLPNHPFQDVSVGVHKRVSLMALEMSAEFLEDDDHQRARQCLQIAMSTMDRAKTSHALQKQKDPVTSKELQVLTDEYLADCDIAGALEALEAGSLITDLALKDMSSQNVKSALNHAWDALDRFKEAETLSESLRDDLGYCAKSAQGELYLNIFKIPGKAKKIFAAIVESSASEYHTDKEWFKKAELALQEMAAKEPVLQKSKLLEEISPDLAKIKDAVKAAGRDIQVAIDFLYHTYPPIGANGTLRPKPLVSLIGIKTAIKKMIYSYHPDKIDKSDMKFKLLCEEITKIFTEMNSS